MQTKYLKIFTLRKFEIDQAQQYLQLAQQAINELDYDSAIQSYKQCIFNIQKQKHLNPQKQQQLSVFENQINQELQIAQQIQKQLQTIKTRYDDRPKEVEDVYEKPQNKRQMLEQKYRIQPKQNYDKPWRQNPYDNKKNNGKKEEDKTKKSTSNATENIMERYPGLDPNFVQQILTTKVTNSNITYDDIAGMETTKRLIDEAILLPLKCAQYFKSLPSWRGILLYSAPGCGKTLLAKAAAAKAQCTLFNCSASTIFSKYVGESEKIINTLFSVARIDGPSIIFMDEIDAICSESGSENTAVMARIRQELLTQMQGVATEEQIDKPVVVLAATNRPQMLDPALRRRLEKRIYVPLPDIECREQILKLKFKDQKLEEDIDLHKVSEQLDGYTGADIDVIAREAALNPLRRIGIEYVTNNPEVLQTIKITNDDIQQAIKKTKPSVLPQEIKNLEKWGQEYGAE